VTLHGGGKIAVYQPRHADRRRWSRFSGLEIGAGDDLSVTVKGQRSAAGVVVDLVGRGQVETDLDPFDRPVFIVGSEGKTLGTGVVQYALLVEIVHGRAGRDLSGTEGHIDGIVLDGRGTNKRSVPVGAFSVLVGVGKIGRYGRCAGYGIDPILVGDLILVEAVHKGGKFVGVHQVRASSLRDCLQAIVNIGADAGLVDLRRLRRDQDHAIGCAATIKGGGGGVLQHAIGFYFIRTDQVDVSRTTGHIVVDRLPIHYDQRLVTGVQGGGAPDTENDGLSRDTAGLLYLEACYFSLQLLPEFRGGHILYAAGGDLADGAGDVPFELFAIADGHLFEGNGSLFPLVSITAMSLCATGVVSFGVMGMESWGAMGMVLLGATGFAGVGIVSADGRGFLVVSWQRVEKENKTEKQQRSKELFINRQLF
jgi:hypothetical protein